MSDYFLNKIYDSLLDNKLPKVKSRFRSLPESYNLIYEQEFEQAQPKPAQPNQSKPAQPNQQITQREQPAEQPILTKFNQNTSQDAKWSPDQQRLYSLGLDKGSKEYIEGMGPGEYAVASVVTGITDPEQLKKHISGQGLSYDIEAGNSKFEVKKLGEKESVRVGVQGTGIGQIVVQGVTAVLNEIKNEYNILSPENKKSVDKAIIGKLAGLTEPEIQIYAQPGRSKSGRAWQKGEEKPESVEARQKYAEWLERRTNWSLDKFADAVLNNPTELPYDLMFGANYSYDRTKAPGQRAKEKEEQRARYVLMSILDLVTYIEELGNIEITVDQNSEAPNRIDAIKKTFKEYYGKTKKEEEQLHQVLDREADKIDYRLKKIRCQISGEDCLTSNNFFKEIKRFDFKSTINELKQKIEDPKVIEELFPITGVFFVQPSGYKYVPKDQLSNYIEIERFSQGGKPKITFKI